MSLHTYTLSTLLQQHKVEIPVIQRDYAQGRTDEHSTEVRVSFAKKLVSALRQNEPVHLDFVYGKIRGGLNQEVYLRNKKSIEDLLKSVQSYANCMEVKFAYDLAAPEQPTNQTSYFIPLDGQQRLTTLLLLHWYLAYRGRRHSVDLSRFSYKTRKSSTDFCTALCTSKDTLSFDAKTISQPLTEQNWFFTEWIYDPTVLGMLTMLDEIHSLLTDASEGDIAIFYDRLVKHNLVTFDFLNLDTIEAEDGLYVKMNSRGKQLTRFENFKAWLVGFIKSKKYHFELNWDNRIDKEWMDILWAKRKSVADIDNSFLNLFIRFAQYNYINKNEPKSKEKILQSVMDVCQGLDIERRKVNEFVQLSFIEENEVFEKAALDDLFIFLQALENNGADCLNEYIGQFSGKPFFDYNLNEILFTTGKSLSYFDKTFLYAVIRFVVRKNRNVGIYNEEDKAQLCSWLRTCQNLIFNARIDEFPEYLLAVYSIHSLSENTLNILQYLSADQKNISYFTQVQQNEEWEKSTLIKQGKVPEKLLLRFEKHAYFYGQIGFLIDLATKDKEFDIETFKRYAIKAEKVFDTSSLGNKDFTLHRALLCMDDYLIEKTTQRFSFCRAKQGSARDRDENWREVFKNTALMRTLLDDDRSLATIIAEDQSKLTDWRKYFVEFPELIRICNQRLIRFEELTGNRQNITLLGESQLNHYHSELYTYVLYLKLKLRHSNRHVSYHATKGTMEDPYMKVMIDSSTTCVYFKANPYAFAVKTDNLLTIDLMADAKQENGFYLISVDIEDLMDKLSNVITAANTI